MFLKNDLLWYHGGYSMSNIVVDLIIIIVQFFLTLFVLGAAALMVLGLIILAYLVGTNSRWD